MKYELTVTCRSGDDLPFSANSFDRIIADDLVSLLSQFIILVASLHRREMEEHGRPSDDDVPF